VVGHADADETAELNSDECTQFTDDIELFKDKSFAKKYTVINDLKEFRKECDHYTASLYSGSSNNVTLPPYV